MSVAFWELLTMMFALAMLMVAVAFAVCMLYDLNKSIPKKHQPDMSAHLTHVYRQRRPSRTMGTEIKDRPKFGD